MLKADTNARSSKPWSKVQALSTLIQLKSGNSSRSPPKSNNSPLVSHSNAVESTPQQTSLELEQQPKPDRLKVFVATWNMYGDLPRDLDLEPFLTRRQSNLMTPATSPTSPSDGSKVFVEHHTEGSPFLDTSTGHPYHLLALGTQECERAIGESLVYSSKEVWEQRLSDYLGDQYKLLKCETLAALHLAVFVWKPVASFVKNIHSADIKTGWANMVGNKGAVAVSLDFGSQSLLFINCHLRAHQTKLAERNANVQRILHQLHIKGGRPISGSHSPDNSFHLSSFKKLTKSTKSVKPALSTKSARRDGSDKSPKRTKGATNIVANKAIPSGTKKSTKIEKEQAPSGQNTTKRSDVRASDNTNATTNVETTPTSNEEPDINGISAKPRQKAANSRKTTHDKQKTKPSKTSLSSSSSSSSLEFSAAVPAEDQHSVTEQFDHVFIFGDTNYRIDAERQFVLDTIKRQDFKTLLKYDQLSIERQKGTTPLACFNEHPIDFIPTYKFDTLESMESSDASSSSLPLSASSAAIEVVTCKSTDQHNEPAVSSPSSSSPRTPTPITTTIESSATSSSHSIVITPKNSLHHAESISIRYDTSPKQRVPSWTDRILWHDRSQHHHHQQANTMTPSGPTLTSISTTTTDRQMNPTNKSKINLKWISALKRKNNNSGLVDEPIDKSTVCYHYNTVLDPRLIGASDHLPVIGIFGVWFGDWDNGDYRRAKSIRSFKTKVPLWRKWLQ